MRPAEALPLLPPVLVVALVLGVGGHLFVTVSDTEGAVVMSCTRVGDGESFFVHGAAL